jgi:hypothetical protein
VGSLRTIGMAKGGHIIWCNAKGMGDREILQTYLNSASKNTSETDIFPHGTKSLLTSVIYSDIQSHDESAWFVHIAKQHVVESHQ